MIEAGRICSPGMQGWAWRSGERGSGGWKLSLGRQAVRCHCDGGASKAGVKMQREREKAGGRVECRFKGCGVIESFAGGRFLGCRSPPRLQTLLGQSGVSKNEKEASDARINSED